MAQYLIPGLGLTGQPLYPPGRWKNPPISQRWRIRSKRLSKEFRLKNQKLVHILRGILARPIAMSCLTLAARDAAWAGLVSAAFVTSASAPWWSFNRTLISDRRQSASACWDVWQGFFQFILGRIVQLFELEVLRLRGDFLKLRVGLFSRGDGLAACSISCKRTRA